MIERLHGVNPAEVVTDTEYGVNAGMLRNEPQV